MNKDAILKLLEAENAAVSATKEKISALENFAQNYGSLKERLLTLPERVSHDVMVPMGSKAFMSGKLVHTNEIMVLLGDGWFVQRSAKQAADIVDRRIKDLHEKIDAFKKQETLLQSRVDVAQELNSLAEEKDGIVEINEAFDEAQENEWRERHKENVRLEKQREREARSNATVPVLPDEDCDLDMAGGVTLISPSAANIVAEKSNATNTDTALYSRAKLDEETASYKIEPSPIHTLLGSNSAHSNIASRAVTTVKQAQKVSGESKTGKKGVKWEDEVVEETAGDTSDTDDTDDTDSDDYDGISATGDTVTCPVIRFRHSSHLSAQLSVQNSDIDMQSPADIWLRHQKHPKSILKPSCTDSSYDADALLSPGAVDTSQLTGSRVGDRTVVPCDKDEMAFTAVITEKTLLSQTIAPAASTVTGVNNSSPLVPAITDVTPTDTGARVSRFKASRMQSK